MQSFWEKNSIYNFDMEGKNEIYSKEVYSNEFYSIDTPPPIPSLVRIHFFQLMN